MVKNFVCCLEITKWRWT